jgi:hypothetical protein
VVNRAEAETRVVDVALLPEHRGRGIGSALMREVVDEADARGAKIVLHVEVFNRARSLYDRLGFLPVADVGPYVRMERTPSMRSGEDRLVVDAAGVAADRNDEDLEHAELGVVDAADPLLEHRLGGAAEEDAERRTPAAAVGGRGAGRVGLGADQLEVEPVAVVIDGERLPHERGEGRHVEAIEHGADANRGFTRRRAIQLGAVAGLSALWIGPSLARASTSATPAYLRRSSYAGLVGSRFSADGSSLRLASVGDLAGAAGDVALQGHDEAFVLEFDGAAGLDGGTHGFSHPDLGSFELFASPVGSVEDGSQRYEVVVDRSIRRAAEAPKTPPPIEVTSEAEKQAAAEELAAATPATEIPGAPVVPAPHARKRRAHKKRHRRHVRARRPHKKARKPRGRR